jgi:hypothetical protein
MSGARSPGSPERMLTALSGFHDAARAAATCWGEDFTVRQGLDITWMLGIVIRDSWIATAALGNFTVASHPEGQPASPGHKASSVARPALSGLPGREGQLTPNGEISEAAQCLGKAAERAVALSSRVASSRRDVRDGGTRMGGDPHHDGPAVAVAHDMRNALGVAAGTWASPSGSDEDRDEIVTQMLFAVDRLQAATLVLSKGGPPNAQVALRWIARDLDSACLHLRESVACSLTNGYQPGTEGLSRQLREAFPVLSEAPASWRTLGPGDGAARLAATAFPHEAGITTTSADGWPSADRATRSPSQLKRSDSPGPGQ